MYEAIALSFSHAMYYMQFIFTITDKNLKCFLILLWHLNWKHSNQPQPHTLSLNLNVIWHYHSWQKVPLQLIARSVGMMVEGARQHSGSQTSGWVLHLSNPNVTVNTGTLFYLATHIILDLDHFIWWQAV